MSTPAEKTTAEWAELCESQQRIIGLLMGALEKSFSVDTCKKDVAEVECAQHAHTMHFVVQTFQDQHEALLAQLKANRADVRRYQCLVRDLRERLDEMA